MRASSSRQLGAASPQSREVIGDNVVRISLPYRQGFVNSFLVLGDDGPRLIDTGGAGSEAVSQLSSHLAAYGHDLVDVKDILITHAHHDHIGLVAEIAKVSGATVLIHKLEVRGDEFSNLQPSVSWLKMHGLSGHSTVERDQFPLPRNVHLLDGSETLQFGQLDLHLSWTPGHSPGLICAFEPARRWLFTSDHLLRSPTPLAIRSDHDADLFELYFRSLDSIAALGAQRALPGHGRAFDDVDGAIEASRAGQRQWLEEVYRAVPRTGALAAQVIDELPWIRSSSPSRNWLSVSRAVAYLQRLEAEGRLRREVRSLVRFIPVTDHAPDGPHPKDESPGND